MAPETFQRMLQMLQIPAPSGREERMAAYVAEQIRAADAEPRIDEQGNVWTTLVGCDSGAGPLALASHTDEIAVVISAIEADGTMRVQRSGGLHPWKLGEGPMQIIGEGDGLVAAHLSFGSGHTTDPKDPITQFASGARGITWADVRLYAGLSAQELAARGVRVGSCAVPAASVRGPNVLGPAEDPLWSAWIFDNRGGSMVLLQLLERLRAEGARPQRNLNLCFMVQEETGLLGAVGWARRNPIETFIAVDSSPVPRGTALALDGSPATWSKDRSGHFHHGVMADLDAAASRAGTRLQYAVYAAAASDATGVLCAGLAPRCATIGYPRENSHGYEVVRASVFDHLTAVLFEYVTRH